MHIKKSHFKILIFALLFNFFTVSFAWSQTTTEPPKDPTKTENPSSPLMDTTQPGENEANALAEAGKIHLDPTAYLMIGIAFLILAVALDRYWVLFKNRGKNEEAVSILTESLVKENSNIDEVISKISHKKYGVEGRVAAVTLKGWKYGVETMHQYSQTAIMAERRFLEKRLIILNTLGNNTPFIGLLGTVLGIMKAFRDLSSQGDAGPAVVMRGISEALVATAMGLAVAIPCVIFYNALAKAMKDKISAAEEITSLICAIRLSVFGNSSSKHSS